MERRLLDCKYTVRSASFATLDRPVRPLSGLTSIEEHLTFVHLLQRIHNAILIQPPTWTNVNDPWASAEKELDERLSFAFTTPKLCKRKTLALVEGGSSTKASANLEAIFPAANALGIDLIVLGNLRHRPKDPNSAYARYRKASLTVDMEVDEDLPERIVSALQLSSHHVDGITSFSEQYLLPTAKAAMLLSLPTSSPDALRVCADKQLTRLNASDRGYQSLKFSRLEELEWYLANDEPKLKYPLVVKLCTTTACEAVKRVHDDSDLWFIALNIFSDTLSGCPDASMLLETCIEEPKIHMNIVLLNKQIIFEGTSDHFRSETFYHDISTADSSTGMKNFTPSRLPASELTLGRDVIMQKLLSMGFIDGVFLVEARIQNSSRDRHSSLENNRNGTDHHPLPHSNQVPSAAKAEQAQPSIIITKINACPPSHEETLAIEQAYGIDLYALHVLFALRHQQRRRTSPDLTPTSPLTPPTLCSSPSSVSSLEFEEFGERNIEHRGADMNNEDQGDGNETGRILALSRHPFSPPSIPSSRSHHPHPHSRSGLRLRLDTGSVGR